jgi:hypothetical protein
MAITHNSKDSLRNIWKNYSPPSVPVLAFVLCRGGHFYECQNQRDTNNQMIPVWL